MKSFVGNKKLLALLLATAFLAKTTTPLAAEDLDPEVDDTIVIEEVYEPADTMVEEVEPVIDDEDYEYDDEEPVIDDEDYEYEPTEPSASPIETGQEFPSYKGSLVDKHPAIFSRRNICVIDTVGDPDGTHVTVYNPEKAQINAFTVRKRNNKDVRGLWTRKVGDKEIPGIQVTRHTTKLYNISLKFDRKYEGYRRYLIGIGLSKLLGQTKQYPGTLLIDEYKHYPIWNVTLRDKAEIVSFITYLSEQNLRSRGSATFDRKPVLRLSLDNDPFLETLELEDFARIDSLFHLVKFSDAKANAYIDKSLEKMRDSSAIFASSNPTQLGESVPAHILRKLERYFNDFNPEDMTKTLFVYGGGIIAGMVTLMLINEKIVKPIGKHIPELDFIGWIKEAKTKESN